MEPARQSQWALALEVTLAVILPIAGLVIAIVLFVTKRTRDATVVLVGTVVGALLALALYL